MHERLVRCQDVVLGEPVPILHLLQVLVAGVGGEVMGVFGVGLEAEPLGFLLLLEVHMLQGLPPIV